MHGRVIKQIIYGSGYLLFFSLIIFFAYYFLFKPAPTCFDNKQNQSETGIDCGGPCQPCAIKNLSPIIVNWVKYLSSGESNQQTIVFAELQNVNQDWGAQSFAYTFTFFDANDAVIKRLDGVSFIYPAEVKYITDIVNIPFQEVRRVDLVIQAPQWSNKEKFDKPILQLRQVNTGREDLHNQGPNVSGFILNQNPFPLKKVKLIAFLMNQDGFYVGVSKTEISQLPAFEEKNFKIIFPKNVVLITDFLKPSIKTYTFNNDLKIGDRGAEVELLQQFLKSQSLFNQSINGIFDKETEKALRAYQQQMNLLPAKGILDQKTRDYINSLSRINEPARPIVNPSVAADPRLTKIYVEASI